MNKELIFSEDSRKYRKLVIVLIILLYTCTIAFSGIMTYEILTKKYELGLFRSLIFIIVCLILALYLTWALCSKYLKYYMFISEDKIIFFENNKEHNYNCSELLDYFIIKRKSQYCVYKLIINNKSHIVTSFKAKEFEETLNKVINKQ